MKVATTEEMREIDRRTIEERGIPGRDLMEQAGTKIALGLSGFAEPGDAVLVLCGRGNNGGDGFVAARVLANSEFQVYVLPVAGTENLSGDARWAFEQVQGCRARLIDLPESDDDLRELFRDADVILDAMLGTGSKPPLRAPYDRIARILAHTPTPIVAADIPSGLDATSGAGEDAVQAALTVTIGLPKLGMLTANGWKKCGRVRIEPIQFPRDLLEDDALCFETLTMDEVVRLLPDRPRDGHKGTFGLVLVCAGSKAMPGASVVSGEGALRSGAGLVRMHVPLANRLIVGQALPEALLAVFGQEDDTLAPLGDAQWEELLAKTSSVVFGPGVSRDEAVLGFFHQLLDHFEGPMVIDADGLSLVAEHEAIRRKLRPNCVLTPHPGEAARLLGCSTGDVQSDRWGAARELVSTLRCPVLLKGFGSLVARPDGRVTHCPPATTALARGSSGDMLAGMVGGLLAQGMEPAEAALLGTFVGVVASDKAGAGGRSTRGLRVLDVMAQISAAFAELESHRQPNL
ncbi:MAG: NAD(P)H-hydrate dehydratase [Sumerlaeia bacterium]